LHHIGHEARRDRFSSFRPPVLSRVTEVGNDASNARGTGSPGSVAEQQELDQVGVYGRACRLNNIDVAAAHALQDLDMLLAVGEPLMVTFHEWLAQYRCDRTAQG
jgi:hypothetical protein